MHKWNAMPIVMYQFVSYANEPLFFLKYWNFCLYSNEYLNIKSLLSI